MLTPASTEAAAHHRQKLSTHAGSGAAAPEFAERVRRNQATLTSGLKPHYDFISLQIGVVRWSVPRWRNRIRRRTRGRCSLVWCDPRAEGISG
jgi:hypothetical protein